MRRNVSLQLFPTIALYMTKKDVHDLVKGMPVVIEHMTHTNGVSWILVAKKDLNI